MDKQVWPRMLHALTKLIRPNHCQTLQHASCLHDSLHKKLQQVSHAGNAMYNDGLQEAALRVELHKTNNVVLNIAQSNEVSTIDAKTTVPSFRMSRQLSNVRQLWEE